ncbi:hypothetical protein, partial [Pantoea wallisii]|uniref:hypothetical protein n=1 Tax=Pantoea wallisii TaxID=1076551 RepID=UPI001ABFD695
RAEACRDAAVAVPGVLTLPSDQLQNPQRNTWQYLFWPGAKSTAIAFTNIPPDPAQNPHHKLSRLLSAHRAVF